MITISFDMLFLLIEGNDDERFLKGVILPIFKNKNLIIRTWKYQQEKIEKTQGFIKSACSMGGQYFFFSDLDCAICKTHKRQKIAESISGLDLSKIVLVCIEIESWYLSGIGMGDCRKLGLNTFLPNTNTLNKEQFNQMIPKNMPRSEFFREIINRFDIKTARLRNKSFNYFMDILEKQDLV